MDKDAFDRVQILLVRVKHGNNVAAGSANKSLRRSKLREVANQLLQRAFIGDGTFLASSRIHRNPEGRPFLHGGAASKLPALSISHSGDYLALALHRMALGLDLETTRTRKYYLEMAEYLFHCEEATLLKKHSPANGLPLFYAYWTMREAIAKASGIPLLELRTRVRILDAVDQSPQQTRSTLFHTSLGNRLQLACFGTAEVCPSVHLCSQESQRKRELFLKWRRYEMDWMDRSPDSDGATSTRRDNNN